MDEQKHGAENHETNANGSKDDITIGFLGGSSPTPSGQVLVINDGSVLLGKDGPDNAIYPTRFVIHREGQREEMCGEILREAFCPCTLEEKRKPFRRLVWSIISSESVVFMIHITVLSLGVAKSALDVKDMEDGEKIELIHSSLETALTILLIAIRMNTTRLKYKALAHHITSMEHVVDPTSKKLRGNALRFWMCRFYFLGIKLQLIALATFLIFKYTEHLDWTILSNNICMVFINLQYGLLNEHLDGMTSRIRGDQEKAVLFESVLLLDEVIEASYTPSSQGAVRRARAFRSSLRVTERFKKPKHINLADNEIPPGNEAPPV